MKTLSHTGSVLMVMGLFFISALLVSIVYAALSMSFEDIRGLNVDTDAVIICTLFGGLILSMTGIMLKAIAWKPYSAEYRRRRAAQIRFALFAIAACSAAIVMALKA